MKSNSTISAAITEYMECSIVKVRTSFINLKVGVSLTHGVSLCFVLLLAFRTCWANTCTANRHLRSSG